MAHQVETMAYAGEVPWHGLGTEVSDNLTPEEMMVAAGLDWRVEKHNIFSKVDGQEIASNDMFQIIRRRKDNTLDSLGVCGPDWVPFQNEAVLKFFSDFVKAGKMKMNTAGALRAGKVIWALAKLESGFTLAGGDEVSGFLLLANYHVWGKSGTALFTPTRVVCQNTLNFSLKGSVGDTNAHRFSMPHINEFEAIQPAALEALGLANDQMEHFEAVSRKLAATVADSKQVSKFILQLTQPADFKRMVALEQDTGFDLLAKLLENHDNKDSLLQDAREGKRQEIIDQMVVDAMKRTARKMEDAIVMSPGADLASAEGTWWGALNGVTHYVDHDSGRDQDASLEQAWFGQRSALKRKAMNLALEYAEAA